MHLKTGIAWVSLSLVLPGCVILPRANAPTAHDHCTLATHSYTLTTAPLAIESARITFDSEHECGAACTLGMITAVPAASLIVSGSIVAAGNTVHWIEVQGRCPDSLTQQAVQSLVGSTTMAGGTVLRTSRDVLHWVKHSAHLTDNGTLPPTHALQAPAHPE